MRPPSRQRVVVYIAAALVAAAFAFAPTPYSLILPGSAIDVRDVVNVRGYPPPAQHYFMTDVTLREAVSTPWLLAAALPGATIVRTSELVPSGVSISQYDAIMRDAMTESQLVAAVVAERAAHLPVKRPDEQVEIVKFDERSRAQPALQTGDTIVRVDGNSVHTTVEVQTALAHRTPGAVVSVDFVHRGQRHRATIKTIELGGKTRLGVYIVGRVRPPPLPVAVKFKDFDVSGSSAGLMFALHIYESLERNREPSLERIAGTGTLAYDGTVGPIEGAPQKLIAAKRAGAQLFFVPRENYAEIASITGIRIVPVHTFRAALTVLGVSP